jgi:hypothetical protein
MKHRPWANETGIAAIPGAKRLRPFNHKLCLNETGIAAIPGAKRLRVQLQSRTARLSRGPLSIFSSILCDP